jgi:uncharacterized OsmC-like protein
VSLQENLIRTKLERVNDYQFRVKFDSPRIPDLVIDEAEPVGRSAGPNPSRLLSAAVAHCLSSSLMFCLARSRISVNDLTASVETLIRRNEKGRWRVAGLKVKLSPSMNADDLPRSKQCLEIFEDFCILTQSVRKGIPVDVDIEMNSSEPVG